MEPVQQLGPALDRPDLVVTPAPTSQPPAAHGAVIARLHEDERLALKAARPQPPFALGPLRLQDPQLRRPRAGTCGLGVIGRAQRGRRSPREAQERLEPGRLRSRRLIDEEAAARIDPAQPEQPADSAYLPRMVLKDVHRAGSTFA